MDCLIRQDMQLILKEYIGLVNQQLPGRIEGIFLYGSIALQASDSSSDIDFLTVVKTRLTSSEISLLSGIHEIINEKYPKPVMDGGYIQLNDIGKVITEPCPYYDGRKMHEEGFYNFNPVTWWTLKHYGITVLGEEDTLLKLDVTAEQLVQYVRRNMKAYWGERLNQLRLIDLSTITSGELDEEIEWSVLGVARQFYTIRERDIISKVDAGNYAINFLPSHRRIIEEAVHIRKGSRVSSYHSEQDRVDDMIRYMEEVFITCENV